MIFVVTFIGLIIFFQFVSLENEICETNNRLKEMENHIEYELREIRYAILALQGSDDDN